MRKLIIHAVIIASTLFMWTACLKTDLMNVEGVQLSPTLAVPIGKVNFVFNDFIKSDSLVKIGADSSVQIVYAQDSIAAYSVADVVSKATGNISVNFNRNIAISDLPLAAFTTAKSIRLEEVVNNFSVMLRTLVSSNYGRSTILPAFTENIGISSALDDLTEYETIALNSGELVLTVQNQFPFPIQNLNIDIIDRGNANSVITTLNIPAMIPNSSTTVSANLQGKSFSNKLSYRIPTLSSQGTGTTAVLVNKDATVNVQVQSRNFKVRSGKFKLSENTLATERIVAAVATGIADQKLQEITLKNATIQYTIQVPSGVSMRLNLAFPTIKMNGNPVTQVVNINSTTTTGTIGLTNAVADLTTITAQPFNQIPVEATATVLASNGFVTINPNDVVSVNSAISNVSVGGAKGQFGTFNLAIPSKKLDFGFDFSFLNAASKKLIFDNPSLRLRYSNSFGIPIEASLNASSTGILGKDEPLSAPTIAFNYPKINQIGQTISSTFTIDKNNSRIVNFLSILPQSITYAGEVNMKSTNTNEINYFTADSKIVMGMDVVIPMKFSTENLILRDTIDANFTDKDVQELESALLKVNYLNGFPLSTSIDILALNNAAPSANTANENIFFMLIYHFEN